MTWVIDASVAAKWLVDEPGSDAAMAYLADDLIAPVIFPLECASVLWKRVRRGELTPDEARERYLRLLDAPVTLEAVDPDVALALAIAIHHPVYDCVYLELADRRGIELVTADKRLVASAAKAGLGHRVKLLRWGPAPHPAPELGPGPAGPQPI